MEKGTGSIRFAFYREQLVLSFSLLGFDPTAQALQLPFNLTLEPYPVSDFLGGIRTQVFEKNGCPSLLASIVGHLSAKTAKSAKSAKFFI